MRLTRLNIQRGRCLTDATITGVSGGYFITGGNGSGKSSMLEGLQLLLYGWSPRTGVSNGSRLGNGAAGYIQDGQDNAIIEAEFDLGDKTLLLMQQIGRNTEFRAYLDGERTAMDRLDVWKSLGFNPRHAALCGLPSQFLDPGSSDDIAKVLAGPIDPKKVYAAVGDYAPWLRDFVGNISFPPNSAESWYGVGDAAYSARTAANRQLKEIDAELSKLPFVKRPVDDNGKPLTIQDASRLQEELELLRQRHRKLLIELGAAGRSSRPKSAIDADIRRTEAALTKAAAKVHAAKANMEATQAHLGELEGQQRALMADEGAARQKMHAAERRKEQALLAIDVNESTCPTCHQELPEETQERRRSELTAASENALAEAQMATEVYAAIRNRTEALQLDIDNAKRDLRKAQDDYGAATGPWQELQDKLRELRNEQPCGRPAGDIEADIAAVEAAMKRNEQALESLRNLAHREALEARRVKLTDEIARLKWCIEAFKDGAVIKRLMGPESNAFALRVNTELEPFGYEMKLEVKGKALNIMLGRIGKTLWPVAACSEGERWLAQFAIAMAFADGCPVILDDVNHLDGHHKDKVRRRLRNYEGTLIVAGAWSKPSNPDLDAMRAAFAQATFVWMERGVATVVNEQEAAA